MLKVEDVKAFTEFCLKPLTDDFRQILEKAKELNLPISEGLIRDISSKLVVYHLWGEFIRAFTYVLVAALVCVACVVILRSQ